MSQSSKPWSVVLLTRYCIEMFLYCVQSNVEYLVPCQNYHLCIEIMLHLDVPVTYNNVILGKERFNFEVVVLWFSESISFCNLEKLTLLNKFLVSKESCLSVSLGSLQR